MIDFGDQQVFRGATTYTAVHLFGKQRTPDGVDYAKVLDLQDGQTQCGNLDAGRSAIGTVRFKARQPQGSKPWVFSNARVTKWLDAVRGDHPTLGEISAKIAQGLVTSADDVFYLRREGKRFRSEATQKLFELEREVVHPILKGSLHMKRWVPLDPDLFVLFPYEKVGSSWRLIPEKQWATNYPLAWAYFKENRKRLEGRESSRLVGKPEWYGFIYPKNLEVMAKTKILVPAIAMSAQYCLDAGGDYHYVGSGGGHAIVPKIKIDLHYLCGLLNSTCLDAFLHWVTTPFHSGWFAYSKAYIAQIPIKLPTTAEDKKLAERITDSVRTIMSAKVKLRGTSLSDRERISLEGDVESYERRIDEDVFRLYGVDGLPG